MAEASSLVGSLRRKWRSKLQLASSIICLPEMPHHVSKATPHKIHGCDLHEGDWGRVGRKLIWNYVIGKEVKSYEKASMVKDRTEAVEPEKNLIRFRVIKGDPMKECKSFCGHNPSDP